MTLFNEVFDFGDNCTWIVLAVAAYLLYTNGCFDGIITTVTDNIGDCKIWVIALAALAYLYYRENVGC